MNPFQIIPFPTPEGIKEFVVLMASGGLELGKIISDAVFLFIEKLFTGLA
jgi:hypothetical protein